jgi:hypothetical protein
LAPVRPPSFESLLDRALRGLGGVTSDADVSARARSEVQAEIGPLIELINRQAAGRAAAGRAAIEGLTNTYMGRLDQLGGQVQADYDRASASSQQANRELAAFLPAQAAPQQAENAAKLGAIQAGPEAQAFLDRQTVGLARGTAGEQFAAGTSGVNRLNTEGAAAAGFAHTLPGIAALGSLQSVREHVARTMGEASEREEEITSRVPGMVAEVVRGLKSRNDEVRARAMEVATSLFSGMSDREIQKAIATLGFEGDMASLASREATAAAAEQGRNARAAASNRAAMDRVLVQQEGQNARTRMQQEGKTGASDRTLTSAFNRAASDASKMKAGTYGGQPDAFGQLVGATGGPMPFKQAYNAVYAGLDAQLTRYGYTPQALRRLTLRALARGGYPVQTTGGQNPQPRSGR